MAAGWDGKYVVSDGEQAGAEAPGCAGSADREGNGWIDKVHTPPAPLEGPRGRFMIPRNQFLDEPVPQECTRVSSDQPRTAAAEREAAREEGEEAPGSDRASQVGAHKAG